MVNASALVNRLDVLDKDPGEGDCVMYFVWNGSTRTRQVNVGIIAREDRDEGWIINGTARYRDQVLFVLSTTGYSRLKRLLNPLAV